MHVIRLRVCSPPSLANVFLVAVASSKLVCHQSPISIMAVVGRSWPMSLRIFFFGLSLGRSLSLLTCHTVW